MSNTNFFRSGSLIRLALYIVAGFLLAWNLLRVWPGERLWVVALVNYFTLWFALGLIPMLVLAILLRDRRLALLQLLALVTMGARFVIDIRRGPPPLRDGTQELKVMTFNVDKKNRNPVGVKEIILSEGADIVLMQELTQELSSYLLETLKETYPYHTLDGVDLVEGQGAMSRFPIIASSPLPDYRYQRITVESPMGMITVLNIHTPTLFPIGWREDWEHQRAFVEELVSEVRGMSGPLLVVGDFNTTPLSENYAILTRVLTDTYLERGSGLGFTYPAGPKFGVPIPSPLVRIDYIFHSRHFSSMEVHVVMENGGSDHLPVVGSYLGRAE
jgi:vancomycin resistance protein VanJ